MLTGKSKDELKSAIEAHFGVALQPAGGDLNGRRAKYNLVGATGKRIVQVEIFNPKYQPDWQIGGWTWNPDLEINQELKPN